jgi:hypothetical protein
VRTADEIRKFPRDEPLTMISEIWFDKAGLKEHQWLGKASTCDLPYVILEAG